MELLLQHAESNVKCSDAKCEFIPVYPYSKLLMISPTLHWTP